MYMDLDGKKLAASILPIQVFEGFIQTQNKKEIKVPWGLFQKILFLYFVWP